MMADLTQTQIAVVLNEIVYRRSEADDSLTIAAIDPSSSDVSLPNVMMKITSSLVRTVGVMAVLWAGAIAHSRAALADQFYSVVHITCAPEIGYFAARRFMLVNPPAESDQQIKSLLTKIAAAHGIYTAVALKDAPLECDLVLGAKAANQPDQKQPLRLRVQGIFNNQNGQATSYRQITEQVEVSAEGKVLGRLLLNPYGFEVGPTDLMEVFYNGANVWVRTCSYGEHVERQPKKGCTEERFR
jgi:hypothetical protein